MSNEMNPMRWVNENPIDNLIERHQQKQFFDYVIK